MVCDEEVDPVAAAVVETVMQAPTPLQQKLQSLASAFQLIAAMQELQVDLGRTGIFAPAGNGLMRIRRIA